MSAAVRGVVAAMAMTGMRRMTTGVGLVRGTPPERIATEGVPALLAQVPPEHRDEAIELAHWAFGAAAGAVFGALPRSVRGAPWAGRAYGVAIWACFEGVLAAALGVGRQKERPASERLAIAADHILYGLIVSERRARR